MDIIKKGIVNFTVKADSRHLNPVGGVHGGFTATVLDSVTGLFLMQASATERLI